jgi:hypothetical protein
LPDLSPTEAARLSGRSRETVFRAMKKGRLSYTVNDAGERRIDPAELERVFPRDTSRQDGHGVTLSATRQDQVTELTVRLEAEREKNEELRRTVEDLRRRLDDSEAERRRVTEQWHAMLSPPAPRRTWWSWRR